MGACVARATAMARMASGEATPVATTAPSSISRAIAATTVSARVGIDSASILRAAPE